MAYEEVQSGGEVFGEDIPEECQTGPMALEWSSK